MSARASAQQLVVERRVLECAGGVLAGVRDDAGALVPQRAVQRFGRFAGRRLQHQHVDAAHERVVFELVQQRARDPAPPPWAQHDQLLDLGAMAGGRETPALALHRADEILAGECGEQRALVAVEARDARFPVARGVVGIERPVPAQRRPAVDRVDGQPDQVGHQRFAIGGDQRADCDHAVMIGRRAGFGKGIR